MENPKKLEFPGEFNDDIRKKCEDILTKVHQAYEIVREQSKTIQKSEAVLKKFKNGDTNITEEDIKKAKDEFNSAKKAYQENATIINDNMVFVYKLYRHYNGNVVVHQIYNFYLAKLLASKEARYPTELYVVKLADNEFNLEEKEFFVTEKDERQGKTMDDVKAEYSEGLQKITHSLEGRYQKRQLMSLFKEGAPLGKIIKELKKIHKKDPEDIKTHILIAKLSGEHYFLLRKHSERAKVKEEAMVFCGSAFSKIDTYLDLQGIDDVSKRDVMRVGFVKTIAAIRKSLMSSSS